MERNSNNDGIVHMTATSSYRSHRPHRSHRPGFMEGVPPPNGGNYVRLVEGGSPPNGGYGVRVRCDGGALRMMRKSPSSFPFKHDAGYIGYLSDDDTGSGGGSGDEGISRSMSMVSRRRRELLGIDGDISFSTCCLLVVMVMMMALVAVWGGFRIASSSGLTVV